MVTKGLNKITQNETQDLQLVDNFCKSWGNDISTTVKDQILRNVWPRSYGHKKSDSSSPHGGCYRTRTYDPLLVRQML